LKPILVIKEFSFLQIFRQASILYEEYSTLLNIKSGFYIISHILDSSHGSVVSSVYLNRRTDKEFQNVMLQSILENLEPCL